MGKTLPRTFVEAVILQWEDDWYLAVACLVTWPMNERVAGGALF